MWRIINKRCASRRYIIHYDICFHPINIIVIFAGPFIIRMQFARKAIYVFKVNACIASEDKVGGLYFIVLLCFIFHSAIYSLMLRERILR